MLSALEISYPAEVLPCPISCPLCVNGQLVIYQDTIDQGQWHHCKLCGEAGDMIELAMKVLKLPVEDSIAHLTENIPSLKEASPTSDEIDRYKSMLDRQKNVRSFLTENSNNFSSSKVLRPFRSYLDADNLARAEWSKRGGDFMVSATREQVDAFIGNCDHRSIFVGWGSQSKDWKEVVVIPFHDLPGRVSALQFCYMNGKTISQFHYRSVLALRPADVFDGAGIAMFQAIDRSDPALGEDLFVFIDPILALHMQIHKLKDGLNLPMPLVAVHPKARPSTFLREHCSSRKLIFWAQKLDVQFFKHVMAANGLIADHRPTEDAFHFLNRFTPLRLVNHLRKVARPWEAVLEEHLASLNVSELSAFMLGLDIGDDELDKFISGCASSTKDRLNEIREKRRQYRRVTVNNRWVMETPRGWQVDKTDEVISEMVFNINRIVHYDDGRQLYYGRARYKRTYLDFVADGASFVKGPLKWLRDYFISKKVGAPIFVKKWDAHALIIAQKFHTPEVVPGLDKCGWDEKRSCFVTDGYFMHVGGRVEDHKLPPPLDPYNICLPEPNKLEAADIELLGKSAPDVALCWAVIGSILHDVLAKVFRYETSGLMVTGEGAETTVQLAKDLCCPAIVSASYHKGWPGSDYLTAIEEYAAWPIAMSLKVSNTYDPRLWLRQKRHNTIVWVEWCGAHTHLLCSHWKYMDVSHRRIEPLLMYTARKAISTFLHALTKRHMGLWHTADVGSLWTIFNNIGAWFTEIGGDRTVIKRQAYDLVRFDEDGFAVNMFYELLAFLYAEGRIISHRSDCVPKRMVRPAILYLSDRPDLIWVPRVGLSTAVNGFKQQLAVDASTISQILADDNKLVDEREINGAHGWVVPRLPWEAALKQRERSLTRKFGVVR